MSIKSYDDDCSRVFYPAQLLLAQLILAYMRKESIIWEIFTLNKELQCCSHKRSSFWLLRRYYFISLLFCANTCGVCLLYTALCLLESFPISHQLTFVMQIRGDRRNLRKSNENDCLIEKIFKMNDFRVFFRFLRFGTLKNT